MDRSGATRSGRNFIVDDRANVAVVFTLILLPILMLIGSAIDFTRAKAADARLKSALDATALALSKAAPNVTAAELNQKATSTLKAIFATSEVSFDTIATDYSGSGKRSLTVSAVASIPTAFMKITGIDRIPLEGLSTVTWGNTRLRVALVLDNTASMADDGKLVALKSASHNLLGQLRNSATSNGDVYVSIIPFNKDVNVGSSNYGATWLRWDQWSNQTCILIIICTNNTNRSSWNGCVTDRDQNYDTTATAPMGSQSTLFPAEQYGSCPTSLLPLSYDWTALNAKVDAMVATGNTNQTIGLQWGFQSLETNSPLAVPATSNDYQYNKVIVLLTDGLNTQNRWSSSQASVDARTSMACSNIKAAGYTLYVVQVSTGGDATSSMLQQCASRPDTFFMLTSAVQIVTTFSQIGTNLSQLRVSR